MNEEMKWIRSISPNKHFQKTLKVGIGDDAAIFSTEDDMENIIAVDTIVEGIHFTKEIMSPEAIGHKALAINISDIAAMGGIPLYYLVSIAIPKTGWGKEELSRLYGGMDRLARKWKMDLIGGDTVSTHKQLVVTVTVLGAVEKDRRLLRANAQPNDIVFVTGKLGNTAYSLERLLRADEGLKQEELEKLKTYLLPNPQVEAGRLLAKSNMRISLNDISDGLASEAKEIADASGVSIIIDWDKVPRETFINEAPLEKQKEWVLYGGEDFQLVGTASSFDFKHLQTIFRERNIPLVEIGTVGKESGQVFLIEGNDRTRLTRTGYDHLATEEEKNEGNI